jgi:hypothetical protein
MPAQDEAGTDGTTPRGAATPADGPAGQGDATTPADAPAGQGDVTTPADAPAGQVE